RMLYFRGQFVDSSTRIKSVEPSNRAAPSERSMIRPLIKGPLSPIVTVTCRPFVRFFTVTRFPKGSVRCAATSAPHENDLPLAVFVNTQNLDAIPISPALIELKLNMVNPIAKMGVFVIEALLTLRTFK